MGVAAHSFQLVTMIITREPENSIFRTKYPHRMDICHSGLIVLFRPTYPLQCVLHQPDNCSTIIQLLDVRKILIPRHPGRRLG